MSKKARSHKARHGASSFGVSGPEMEARRAGRLSTIAILKGQRLPLVIVQITDQAVAHADLAVAQAVSTNPPAAPQACQAGCAWCCYKTVGIAAPEVFRIADHLRTHLSQDALLETVNRIIRLDQERRAAPPDKRSAARPCSLLENDRCIAYPVRPLTCRGFNSSDARHCELSLDPRNKATIPAYQPQQRLHTLVLDGVRSGLIESGLPGELLELTAALRVALTSADAETRWLAGQDVFAKARFG
jgi:Fe-S-cluster containining protein